MLTTFTLPLLNEGRKKKWSYSTLFFSLFFFSPLLVSGSLSTSLLLKNLVIYLVFVGAYLVTIGIAFRRLPYALLFLFCVSFFSLLFNAGGIVFFGFFTFIMGYYYSPKWAILICGATAALLLAVLGYSYENPNLMFGAVMNMGVLYGFGLMERNETLAQQKDELHNISLQKLSAITERERIGRDLHDIAGHALSSISLKAQVAAKYLEKNNAAAAKEEVLQLATLSQNLLSEIRQAVTQIKQLGFDDEVDKASVKLSEAGFDTNIQIDKSAVDALSPLQETQFSLLLKEAITNILRHSQGNRADIRLFTDDAAIYLQCSDNGEVSSYQAGNGLTGMRERIEALNGRMNLDNSNGFSITVTLPMQHKDENE